MKKRIEYLDQLRFCAILSIILLHCIAIFRYQYYDNDSLSFFAMTFLDAFTRFGVPMFFMLTGALMLPKKEENYKEFCQKRIWKLIVAYVFFSGIYYIYKVGIHINLFEFIRQVTSFKTEYHLWFMPAIILIYVLIPYIKRLVEFLSKEELKRLITIVFILGNGFVGIQAISNVFGYSILSNFTFPSLIIYINYLFLGYYLYKNDCIMTKQLVISTVLSLFLMPIATIFISKTEVVDTFLDCISPLVIAPSIFVFLWFKNQKYKKQPWTNAISTKSLYIYLIHVLPLTIISKYIIPWINTKGFLVDVCMLVGLWIVVSILSILFAYIWTFLKEWVVKHWETISKIGIIILMIILGIGFTGLILSILINPYHVIKMNIFLTIGAILIWLGILYLIMEYQEKIFKKKIVSYILLGIYFLLQIGIAYYFQVKPSWDFGRIFENAIEFAKSAHPAFGNEYLYVCSNNIILSVFFDCVFKIFTIIGIKKYVWIGIMINIFAIDISLFYLYKLLNQMNPKYSKVFIVFCMMFSPLLFYIPIFYSDTLTLPFIIIPIYYLYNYFFINPKVRYIMIVGSLMGMGAMVKPTVLIPTIAIILFLVLRRREKFYHVTAVLLSIVCVLLLGKRIFINHFFDRTSLELYEMPTSHFILLGLKGNGGYSEESYKKINQVLGQEERNKIAKAGIQKRMKELTKKHQWLSFYYKKINYTWTDGTFYAGEKLRREPVHKEMTKYIYSSKNEDWLYWAFSNGEWILVLCGMLLGIVFRKHLPKELQDFQLILMMSTFGIFLFLIIWETRSRYLVNFVPIFLLNAYLGICAIENKMDRRIKK